jgi:hypothetical protein
MGSKEALTASSSPDRYHALYMLLRSSHPRLHGRGSSQQPEQRDNESFLAYMVRIHNYALDELTLGNHLSDHALVGMSIRNVHSRFRHSVNQHLDATYRKLDPGDDITFTLHINQIACTMDETVVIYSNGNTHAAFSSPTAPSRPPFPAGGTRPTYNHHSNRRTGRVYHLADEGDDTALADFDQSDIDDVVHQINSAQVRAPGSCYLCHSTAHQAQHCPELIQAI